MTSLNTTRVLTFPYFFFLFCFVIPVVQKRDNMVENKQTKKDLELEETNKQKKTFQ